MIPFPLFTNRSSNAACAALLCVLTAAAASPALRAQSPGQPAPPVPYFTWLGLGEVKPAGWIQEQMLRDLHEGFAGHLNELCPEANSDIFVTGRNGLAAANVNNSAHNHWWNGETEGNWRTGFIMLAYLSGDKEAMAKADAFVAHVLAAQDADGYLGIDAPALRYKATGELWTQACLLRGLLAYAELTGRKDVLTAVERAVTCTKAAVTSGANPLTWADPHDLMLCDVLERLYDLTGDASYRDFGLWLYSSYCKAHPHDDVALQSLLDLYGGFYGHGVHTYEHLRVPLWLWSFTGRQDLGIAWRNGFEKVARYSYPGGAAVSQEDIGDCPPDPTFTQFEYCAAKELQCSMESALQKTGETRFADRTELVWFNDEQSGRLADGSALTYLTNENRLQLDDRTPNGAFGQPRNRYSPTQRQVAVCCPPNASQVSSLYVRGMWMRHGADGLAALLYGPCLVSTRVGGVLVHLKEATAYPFQNSVLIRVQPDKPLAMTLLLRNPAWSEGTTVTSDGAAILREGDYWQVRKTWKPGDTVRINFTPAVRTITAVNGQVALQYGSLLFAKPIDSKEAVVTNYPLGFHDLHFLPAADTSAALALPKREPPDLRFTSTETGAVANTVRPPDAPALQSFKAVWGLPGANLLRPFDAPVVELQGTMVDTAAGNAPQMVTLVPLGNADELRRVTFPLFHYIQPAPSPADKRLGAR
jgi:DUF1680 family protein